MRGIYQEHNYLGLSFLVTVIVFVGMVVLFDRYETIILDMVQNEQALSTVLFVAVFALSIVAVPVSAVPLIALGVQVWGIWLTVLLSVTGWTIGAVVAFWIARYFGEPVVRHVLSTETQARIEHYVTHHHIFLTIAVMRAILPFDGLSYVLGLVPYVRFYTFVTATVVGLIPFCITVAYLGALPLYYLLLGAGLLVVVVGLYIVMQRHESSQEH